MTLLGLNYRSLCGTSPKDAVGIMRRWPLRSSSNAQYKNLKCECEDPAKTEVLTSNKSLYLRRRSYISALIAVCVTTLFWQSIQTTWVIFSRSKEMGVGVSDGELSICHCAEAFGWNQREMRAFKRTGKAVSRARLALCAPQIWATRLDCFLFWLCSLLS